ncbi:hypothetical protein COI51_05760 [Bacillus toyonensis]|uniref:Uncharacterized protein n=1 Tax=Bacillus toyonensis TaxID=155322 RepID=A0A2B5TDA4_9BACI|nr:hypothetical protein COO04_08010 [Bacillus toyonensis]PEI89578.1 hypothetical protein CN678_02435 [Bacillus toyonensis]PEK10922.1 hypothetical protein CN681_10200 [Bacillus toyonensis]PEK47370.1 hypothetical protein CN586_12630 [Bacillus toyonensis]PEL53699.1 hypothetical protein CN638_06180 [Bacillus toyonensis]
MYKAEAARLECEGDGAPDVEALFASQEGAKPPNILAAEARFHQIKKPPIGGFLIYLLLIFHFP